jgi:hypothetical protein
VEWNVRNREERSGDIAVANAVERSTAAQDLLMDQVRSGAILVISDDEPVLSTCCQYPWQCNAIPRFASQNPACACVGRHANCPCS